MGLNVCGELLMDLKQLLVIVVGGDWWGKRLGYHKLIYHN